MLRLPRWVRSSVLALLCCSWGAGTSFAEERVLLDTLVEAERLVLEVDNAEIQVFLEGEDGALLRATAPAQSMRPEALEMTRRQGVALVSHRPSAEASRLRIDLLASPRLPLRIAGRDLLIRIEPATSGASTAGEVEDLPSGDTGLTEGTELEGWPLLELDIEASELVAYGARDVAGKAEESALTLHDSLDSVRLELRESTTELEGHQGLVELRVFGGEAEVRRAEGSHEIWSASKARIRVSEGLGRLRARLTEGSRLRLDDFRGDVGIEGVESFVEGRRLWSAGKGTSLEGENSDFVLEDCRGPFQARLRGGRLAGAAFLGEVEITGLRGAGVELEDLKGRLALWLRGGSAGSVAEARGRLEANVENARLEVADVQRLDLTAKDAELGVRGLRAIAGFRAQSSRLDLDLRSLEGNKPVLHLLSRTYGAIQLTRPCRVQIGTSGRASRDIENVDVSGCEIRRVGVSEPETSPPRIDSSRHTLLTIDIAPDAQIEIEGY